MCDYSNGTLYFLKNFNIDNHYKNLYNQIRRVFTKNMGWEAVMRTRFSKGVKITNFITPILISNEDLMVMPAIDR